MANESLNAKTATSSSSSSSTADSYIGSFISLTSKYEIRYEGVLYYLNPQDSTLGLKTVKSYGTEGRRKDGPQIPPSDKVYEYILFRGNDIKDLQVKSSPPPQVEEPIHDDPAIIQSQFATGPSSSSKSLPVSGGSLPEFSPYMEGSALNMRTYPSAVSSQQSGVHNVEPGPSQMTQSINLSSYDMPNQSYPSVLSSQQSGVQVVEQSPQMIQSTNLSSYATPSNWQGYNAVASGSIYAQQRPIPSAATSLPSFQNFFEASPVPAPTTTTLTSSSINLPPMPSLTASSSVHPNIISSHGLHQVVMPAMNVPSFSTSSALPAVVMPAMNVPSFSTSSALPAVVMPAMNVPSFSTSSALPAHPNFFTLNALNMSSFPPSAQNVNKIEESNVGKVLPGPAMLQTAQSLPYSAPSIVDSSLGSILKQSLILPTPDQLSQPRLPEIAPQVLYPDRKDVGLFNVASSRSSSSITTPVNQAPVLQLQPRQQFTEEFDFEAMNEKFKKDEVWGYLGKAKQKDTAGSIQDNGTICQTSWNERGDGLAVEADSKAAYNKDEFFDSISCNTTSRRDRNGQNRFSDRMRLDTETFGQFQQRNHPVYGGPGGHGGHGNRNQYGWGRGYNPGSRGRGGYMRY